jgi:hypothetical protein
MSITRGQHFFGRVLQPASRKISNATAQSLELAVNKSEQFIAAIQCGDYQHAEAMVKKRGVNVDGYSDNGTTALIDAVKRGDVDGARFLLKTLNANLHVVCSKTKKTPLHFAEACGNESMKNLLSSRANFRM